MTTPHEEVRDEELPERQRTFLQRLRQHDKRVKVFRSGARNVFHGPVIGDGLMPADEPAITDQTEEP
jgi:hypothetical protein